MCVMPAMGTFRLAFACIRKPFSKASRLLRTSAAASMTNRRKSVATSSLRLRPVCNFHPSGDFVEGGKSLPHFHFGEDAYSLKSLCPDAIHGDFVGKQPAIERKRTLEGVEARIWRVFKTPSPQPIVFAFRLHVFHFPGNAHEFSLRGL